MFKVGRVDLKTGKIIDVAMSEADLKSMLGLDKEDKPSEDSMDSKIKGRIKHMKEDLEGVEEDVHIMATLGLLRTAGPVTLLGMELVPVKVDAYEFHMEHKGESTRLGTVPKEAVLSALKMTPEEFDAFIAMTDKIKGRHKE